MRGVFPGTFDPPTRAHIAIALKAIEQFNLDHLVFTLSTRPINKEDTTHLSLQVRKRLLEQICHRHLALSVATTDDRLLSDIARGYDFLILGSDKIPQLHDPSFYGSRQEMERKLSELPNLIIATRGESQVHEHLRIDLPYDLQNISATRVREGELHLASSEYLEYLDNTAGKKASRKRTTQTPPKGSEFE